ncbi:hypothetical protein [Bradyrhizobium sp. USDA 329]|uniref:hypothetical protein n=1 Tax=unclassified Bradyrhizobium TaxID=2631580 RepID=UPI00351794B4
MLIAVPNADDPRSGNHESRESKIPKRKNARPDTRLSCKIEYFIETTSAYLSGRSAFFTNDGVALLHQHASAPNANNPIADLSAINCLLPQPVAADRNSFTT